MDELLYKCYYMDHGALRVISWSFESDIMEL